MDQQEALKLSDTYIQRCDTLNDIVSINNLSFKLVKHYTEIIHSLSEDILPNKLSRDISSYVLHHLSENIKTEDIANALYIYQEVDYQQNLKMNAMKIYRLSLLK